MKNFKRKNEDFKEQTSKTKTKSIFPKSLKL